MKMVLRLGLSLASLLVLFAILETGFRAVATWRGRFGVKWAVYDPELGYRLNPEWGDISDQGLRDHPVGPKGAKPRILILGDSVAFNGDSIDDTWVGHMRAALGSRSGGAVEVVNASVRGYTTRQELLYLERDGLAFEPDVVGLGFVLNDLHEVLTRFRVEDGEIVSTDYDFTEEATARVDSALYQLARRSRLLVVLRRRLASSIDAVLLAASDGYSFDARPDFMTAWQDEPWLRVEAQLGKLAALGRRHGFGVFVQVTPFADQYRPEYLARDRAYVLKPQRRLAAICERLELPLLDLYALLDAGDFETDAIHLSARGRRRVGEATARFLVDESLVPDG